MTTEAESKRSRLRHLHEKFVVEVRTVPAPVKRRLYWWAGGLFLVGIVCFVVILIDVVHSGDLSSIDAPIQKGLDAARSEWLTATMIGLAILFGPVVLPIVILVGTVWWTIAARHIWRPLMLALGTLTGVIVHQIVLGLVARERPSTDGMLFGVDTTYSFPSGHVMGASNFILLVTYLVYSRRTSRRSSRVAFAIAGVLILLAAVSRVYLGYHWATDALASISLSMAIVGAVIALDTWRTVRVPGKSQPNPEAASSEAL